MALYNLWIMSEKYVFLKTVFFSDNFLTELFITDKYWFRQSMLS